MYRCPNGCGQFGSRQAAANCCGFGLGQILGVVEFEEGVRTGDVGEQTAGLLEMGGVDPLTANVIGAIEDMI